MKKKVKEESFADFVVRQRGEFVIELAKGNFELGFWRALDAARGWGHNRGEELARQEAAEEAAGADL